VDIKAALTQKVGPFPGYIWVGIVAVGGWFLLKARGSSGGTTSSGTPIFAPGPPGAGPQGVQGPPGPAGVTPTAGSTAGVTTSLDPFGNPVAFDSSGTRLTQPSPQSTPLAQQQGETAAQWAARVTEYWRTHPAGVGGPRSIGSRRAQAMSAHHPDLKRSPRIPHVVQAIGGPATHKANVHRIAAAAGVHPARLLILNPYHTGLVHIQ
jgi:hypothetical protein